jgi:CBS domain-containing protein
VTSAQVTSAQVTSAQVTSAQVEKARLRVGDVMSRDLVVVPGWLTVSTLLARVAGTRHAVYPVVNAAGEPLGVLDLAALRHSATTTDQALAEVCIPLRDLRVAEPDDRMRVPNRHLRGPHPLILVVQDRRLVGIIGPAELVGLPVG